MYEKIQFYCWCESEMMKRIVASVLLMLSTSELVQGGLVDHHERATSYQNLHIEHFHPVPTYVKKEHQQLLDHPIAIGQTSSKVEVHHGGEHDHGYAFQNLDSNLHGFGDASAGGYEEIGGLGHEAIQASGYEVHDQGEELGQLEGHLGGGHEALEAGYVPQTGLEGYHQY